jgi:hypothetical protein
MLALLAGETAPMRRVDARMPFCTAKPARFCVAGARLIDLLVRAEPCLAHQLTNLYERLHDACGPTVCGEAGRRYIHYHPEAHTTDTGLPVV